ncbi:MAG TPA: DUF2997 domain-containing protein [Candidatus Obscuribacterales bacterium]
MAKKRIRRLPDGAGSRQGTPPAAPEIHIEIDLKGNIVLETRGTAGNQCDLLSGALESSLGSVTSRVNKRVYGDGC